MDQGAAEATDFQAEMEATDSHTETMEATDTEEMEETDSTDTEGLVAAEEAVAVVVLHRALARLLVEAVAIAHRRRATATRPPSSRCRSSPVPARIRFSCSSGRTV